MYGMLIEVDDGMLRGQIIALIYPRAAASAESRAIGL